MSGALDGIRVLDFGQYIAGPLLAMMLADQGAEVLRIDPPGGPMWDHPANAILQRGKKSIGLDLKRPDDVSEAERLATGADVLIENFRPGVMARLGLGAERLSQLNPRLIYCSLPGFSAEDPRVGLRAFEGVVGAAAGLHRLPQFVVPSEERPADVPIFSALPLASSFAAFVASHSVLAALIARRRSGRGQTIEAPLYDAATLISADRLCARDGEPAFPIKVPADMVRLQPLFGNHRCQDGRWIFISPPIRGAVAFAERHLQPLPPHRPSEAETAAFRTRVEALFRTRSAADWETIGNLTNTGVAACQTTDEWLGDAHARASGCVVPLEDPALGPTWQLGYPVALSVTPPRTRGPRRPTGADQGAGFAAPALKDAPHAAAIDSALAGFRVIDCSQILAGPTSGRILAAYGAEVIKINDPRPDANPSGLMAHAYVNAGKRAMLLDIASEQGRRILMELVEGADVFHQNFVRGAADRMGFGEEAVRDIRPDIIYSSVNTHAEGGFRTTFRGHEELGQAVTGIQERYGGDAKPETHAGWTLCDYATGHLSAFAILLALFHREQTGEPQHVSASLSAAGGYYQAPFMLAYEGQVRDEPRGLDAKGWNAQDRFYRASDGWFYVAAPGPEGRQRLITVAGVGAALENLETELAKRFAAAPARHWVARLVEADLGAHLNMDFTDVMADETALRRGLIFRWTEDGHQLTCPTGSASFSLTPPRTFRLARPPGSDTLALLDELGHGARFAEWRDKGIVGEPSSQDQPVQARKSVRAGL